MNAITANAPQPSGDARTRKAASATRRRRRTVLGAAAATFLGLYVLGVSWFANSLQADMERSLQVAPAIQDVAHR